MYICLWGIPCQIDQAETLKKFLSLENVLDDHKKMTHANFQIIFKISLAVMVENVDLALRVVIDSSEIYTIISVI